MCGLCKNTLDGGTPATWETGKYKSMGISK